MNEFPLRCLCVGFFMRVFLACHITCHIGDETLPAAPSKYISLLFPKCALAVCSVPGMQRFLIKCSNEQEYREQARCFIKTRGGEVSQVTWPHF